MVLEAEWLCFIVG